MTERVLPLLLDARRARKGGPEAGAERQRARLAEMVRYACAHSRYYAKLYARLLDRVDEPTLLPITNKRTLMSRYPRDHQRMADRRSSRENRRTRSAPTWRNSGSKLLIRDAGWT